MKVIRSTQIKGRLYNVIYLNDEKKEDKPSFKEIIKGLIRNGIQISIKLD